VRLSILPHNQRTGGKAYKDMAQEMTLEEKKAKFKKLLQKITRNRKRVIEKARKNYIPPRYDNIYFEGVDWLNKNG
jgi:HEPN domain-containing protein